jgi:hypothetical protein
LSLRDELHAIERSYLGLDETAIPTESRVLNGVIIADGTSSTATKMMKDTAMKSGASAASGTSYTAAKILEAVGGPETANDDAFVEALALEIVQKNQEIADETRRSSACSPKIDGEDSQAPLRAEIRSASAPRLGSTPTKNGMESPGTKNSTTRRSSVPENPFRPKVDLDCPIFTDLPPTVEESPEHHENDRQIYHPRKTPIDLIDGNLECRNDAAPDPIDTSCIQAVHRTQIPIQGIAGQSPFTNEPLLYNQGSSPQQYPAVVFGDQVPINNPRYISHSTQQNMGNNCFNGHRQSPHGYHPDAHHVVPPMNRRLSTIRNVDIGYVQPVHQASPSTKLPAAHDGAGRGKGPKRSPNKNGKRNTNFNIYNREQLPSTAAVNKSYDQRRARQPSTESNFNRHQTYGPRHGHPFDKGRMYSQGRYHEADAGFRGDMSTQSPPMPSDNGARRDATFSSYTTSMKPHRCLNLQLRKQSNGIHSSINYVACPCDLCWAKDSSVHVNGFQAGKLNDPEVANYVKKQFAKFGEIRDFLPSNRGNSCEIR